MPILQNAGTERVQAAVLKLSGGSIDKLVKATDLAKADWRDVLMAAGFGEDPKAHEEWLKILG